MTLAQVQDAIQILKGATMIVYPMGLPPHDPVSAELENNEDLSGTQVCCRPCLYYTVCICIYIFSFIYIFPVCLLFHTNVKSNTLFICNRGTSYFVKFSGD